MDKLQLLKKYWGYSKFRSYQEQIIDSLLEGKDVMGILPTGGGKSLCYQLPALILEGSVLVISPLIALMMDQVRKLEKQGIKAMYFESHSKSQPIQEQIDNCIHGNYRLVYCSPERFLNPLFIWGYGIIPAFGIAGLAIATVISQLIGTIYFCLLYTSDAADE